MDPRIQQRLEQPKSSLLSAIMKATGLRSRRRAPSGRFKMLGMNGVINRGEVRHCDTWEFPKAVPQKVAEERPNFRHAAWSGRVGTAEEGPAKSKRSFYDFLNR